MKIASLILVSLFLPKVFAARVEVDVQGLACSFCVEAVVKELTATEKAEHVHVNVEDKKTSFDEIKGKKISDTEIRSAIRRAGYEASKIRRKNL